jgi:hypothetical protein
VASGTRDLGEHPTLLLQPLEVGDGVPEDERLTSSSPPPDPRTTREVPMARAAQRVQQLPLHSARTPPCLTTAPLGSPWIWLWSKLTTCSVAVAFYETNQVTRRLQLNSTILEQTCDHDKTMPICVEH